MWVFYPTRVIEESDSLSDKEASQAKYWHTLLWCPLQISVHINRYINCCKLQLLYPTKYNTLQSLKKSNQSKKLLEVTRQVEVADGINWETSKMKKAEKRKKWNEPEYYTVWFIFVPPPSVPKKTEKKPIAIKPKRLKYWNWWRWNKNKPNRIIFRHTFFSFFQLFSFYWSLN